MGEGGAEAWTFRRSACQASCVWTTRVDSIYFNLYYYTTLDGFIAKPALLELTTVINILFKGSLCTIIVTHCADQNDEH